MKRRKKSREKTVAAVQIRNSGSHPYGLLRGYMPLDCGEAAIYRAIREAVPLVDAAVMKLIRLCGGFTVSCGGGRGSGCRAARSGTAVERRTPARFGKPDVELY